jgi:D-inositol-3-phosphate glycosyltransferase
MRIGYLVLEIPQKGRPGPSDIVWDMSKEMCNAGHDVHIIAPQELVFTVDSRIKLHRFKVPPFGYRWFIGYLWTALNAARVAKKLPVDIIHAPEYLSTAILTLIDKQHPIILTVPGNIFQRLSIPQGNQSSFFNTETIKWAARVSAKRCAFTIAFTREMKKWWQLTGSKPEKTPVIPYGVDTSRYKPIQNPRAILNLPADSFMILFVGRLDREKGLLDAIEALAEIKQLLFENKARFDLVGIGPMQNEMEIAIRQYGLDSIVHFHGPKDRDELPIWYSAADILLLPSWIEPFGRVILEAMACGTPIVSSVTDGPIDHIKDGYNGYLFPPRQPLAMAKILEYVIKNHTELNVLGNNALSYVLNNLSWSAIMEQISKEVYLPTTHGTKIR